MPCHIENFLKVDLLLNNKPSSPRVKFHRVRKNSEVAFESELILQNLRTQIALMG